MTVRLLALATTFAVVLAGVTSAGAQTKSTTTTSATTTSTTPSSAPGTTVAPPSTTVAPRGSTEGVTPKSIKVGGLGYTFLYGGADIGARARFARANATGGVNGRMITYTGFTDDGGDPARNTQMAAKLALQDRVFAVVPAVSADMAGSATLVQQRVPYFGWALSSNFCGNQYGFGFTGCLLPPRTTSNAWGTLVLRALGAPATGRTAAILTEATPSGKYQLRALTSGLTSAKLRVVDAKSSLPAPAIADYTAIAKEVLTSNAGKPPDAIFVVGSISSVSGVRQALTAAGYAGVFTNQLQYGPNLVAPSVGAYVMIGTAATETAPTNPAMQQLVADVQKVAPNQPIDQGVIAGYFSADLFLAAVTRAGPNLTVDTLLRAANHKFTYSVANTVGPTKFPAAHEQPTPCGSLVTSDGISYGVKVPYRCGKVVAIK